MLNSRFMSGLVSRGKYPVEILGLEAEVFMLTHHGRYEWHIAPNKKNRRFITDAGYTVDGLTVSWEKPNDPYLVNGPNMLSAKLMKSLTERAPMAESLARLEMRMFFAAQQGKTAIPLDIELTEEQKNFLTTLGYGIVPSAVGPIISWPQKPAVLREKTEK